LSSYRPVCFSNFITCLHFIMHFFCVHAGKPEATFTRKDLDRTEYRCVFFVYSLCPVCQCPESSALMCCFI
jgi:hypothetical protein